MCKKLYTKIHACNNIACMIHTRCVKVVASLYYTCMFSDNLLHILTVHGLVWLSK